jgi:hypothetical protein
MLILNELGKIIFSHSRQKRTLPNIRTQQKLNEVMYVFIFTTFNLFPVMFCYTIGCILQNNIILNKKKLVH